MSIEKLQARVELLKAEVQKAQSNVALLKEQLEKSESHVHMVIGHMNEANFLLQEEVRDAGGVELPLEAPAEVAPEAPAEEAEVAASEDAGKEG